MLRYRHTIAGRDARQLQQHGRTQRIPVKTDTDPGLVWYIRVGTVVWGTVLPRPMPADYNGDGRTDPACGAGVQDARGERRCVVGEGGSGLRARDGDDRGLDR
jgi:hypothetical protein